MAADTIDPKVKEELAQLVGEFKKGHDGMAETLAKQNEEIKKIGGTSSETSKQIRDFEEKFKKLTEDFMATQEKANRLEIEGNRKGGHSSGGDGLKSLGEMFGESNAFQDFHKDNGWTQKTRSDIFTTKSLYPGRQVGINRKALTGIDDVRAVIATERLLEIFAQPLRKTRVRDLFPTIKTTLGSIDYVRETGFANAAAIVAESGTKPESALEFALETAAIRTIAHWVPVARQILEDIPALQGYIDTRLVEGLYIKEDQQLLFGDGLGSNLLGIMNTPGRQQYDWGMGKLGDTKIDAIRRACTRIRVAEYETTGIVLNPYDWEDIELQKDNDGRYIWMSVPQGAEQRMFRVPVIDTTAMTEGAFCLGSFALAAAIWDREQANVRIADQHADYFIKNMLVILAEERLGLTVYRPEAFLEGSFNSAPAS